VSLIGFLLVSIICRAQTEHGLLPFSNKLLLNPSFAGFDKSTSVWTNLQFFSESPYEVNHSFTVTYDKWSEKMKAGVAWYFYHGLQGKLNTNHDGAGFTLTKPITFYNGKFIPSLNINYWIYTKQWFAYVLDSQLDKEIDTYLPPGKSFFVYNQLTPRVGMLWDSPLLTVGFSASYSYRHFIADPDPFPDFQPFHLLIHASQKTRGNQNGLESKPFKASPELVIMYSNQQLITRAGFRMVQVGNLMALFVQNNFTDNIHGIAGIFGFKSESLNVSLTAGGAYSIQTKKPSLFGEISLGYVIPYNFVNDDNPWAPPNDSF
jgi:hypothetical protein